MKTGASLPHESRRSADAAEAAFVVLLLAIVAGSLVAVALAWIGWFRPLPLVLCSGAAIALSWMVAARSFRSRPRPRPLTVRASVTLAAIAGVGAWTFFRPAEYHFDGLDGSAYSATASMLARHGTLSPPDAVTASLPLADRARLFAPPPDQSSEAPVRFPGGMNVDIADARLRTEFFHLYPIWTATAEFVAGRTGRWYVNPALALLAVVAIWLLGRRLSGSPLAGECAAALLLVNLAQIWFARAPSAEVSAQFLVLSGLFLMTLADDVGSITAGAAGAASIALAAFARLEVLLFVAPLVAWYLFVIARTQGGSRRLTITTVVFLSLAGVAGWYALANAGTYTLRVTYMLISYIAERPERVALALAFLLLVFALPSFLRSDRAYRATLVAGTALLLLSAGVLLQLDLARGHLLQVVTPAGLGLGLAGFGLLAIQQRRRALLASLVFLVGLTMLRTMPESEFPWSYRKCVPLLLPFILIGVGHLVVVAHRRLGPLVLLGPALLCGAFLFRSWPVLTRPVMRDGTAQLEAVRERLDPRSLILWAAGTPTHLAIATHLTLGLDSVVIGDHTAADATMTLLIASTAAQGRPVMLAVDSQRGTAQRTPWPDRVRDFDLRWHTSADFSSESLARSREDGALFVRQVDRRVDFYALVPRSRTSLDPPLRIDLGDRDLPWLLEGFFPAEQHGHLNVRWTRDRARLRIPRIAFGKGVRVRLVLRVATRRPPDTPTVIEATCDGVAIGAQSLASDFSTASFDLDPACLADGAEITLTSTTFVPKALGIGTDTRVLGVLIDWLAIESVPSNQPRRAG